MLDLAGFDRRDDAGRLVVRRRAAGCCSSRRASTTRRCSSAVPPTPPTAPTTPSSGSSSPGAPTGHPTRPPWRRRWTPCSRRTGRRVSRVVSSRARVPPSSPSPPVSHGVVGRTLPYPMHSGTWTLTVRLTAGTLGVDVGSFAVRIFLPSLEPLHILAALDRDDRRHVSDVDDRSAVAPLRPVDRDRSRRRLRRRRARATA